MSRITRIVGYLKSLATGNLAPANGRLRDPVDVAVEAALEENRKVREAHDNEQKRKEDIWLQRQRWQVPAEVYSGPAMTPHSYKEVDNLPDLNDPDRMEWIAGEQRRPKRRMKGLYWENGILHALYEDTREEFDLDETLVCRIELETNQVHWWQYCLGAIMKVEGQVLGDHDLDCLAKSPLFKFQWSTEDGRWERHAPIMRLRVQWKGQIIYSRDVCLHVPGLGGLYRVDEQKGILTEVEERPLDDMLVLPERSVLMFEDEYGNLTEFTYEPEMDQDDDIPEGCKVGYVSFGRRYATGRSGMINEGPNYLS